MVAFDHRNSLERDLTRLGVDATAGRRAELKSLIWQGIEAALPGVPAHADAAILIDRGHRRIEAAARDANVAVAIALEASGQDAVRPEATAAELREDLQAIEGGFGKVLLRWHPADPDSRKRRQLATLHQLADLSGARLLLELLVPPSPEDLAGLAAGRRYDEALLPRHQYDAVAELLHAGLSPALWKVEGHPDAGAALALAELVASCDPSAAILILGGGAEIADLGRAFSGGAGLDVFSGFAVGRSIWWGPIAELCRGEITAAGARCAIGNSFLAVIGTFEATARRTQPAGRG